MRIFAISDLHLDYKENSNWFFNISKSEYRDDLLIIAGDISDRVPQINSAFKYIKSCFKKVLFVPGNHDLWVSRTNVSSSILKFKIINKISEDNDIITGITNINGVAIVPLLGWYDFSFGKPAEQLFNIWMDFFACKWPEGFDIDNIAEFFLAQNKILPSSYLDSDLVISFSHFLPRIDIMPFYIPFSKRIIYPALGTTKLDVLVKNINSRIHIYGHSHVNQDITKDGIRYINNAYGYPNEKRITMKELKCIYEF